MRRSVKRRLRKLNKGHLFAIGGVAVSQQLRKTITVLGAGSWGTALALLLARRGLSVRLWGHNPEHMQTLQRDRCNKRYLPDCTFPECLVVESNLSLALQDVADVLVVVPSFAFRAVLMSARPYFCDNVRLVWGTKGLDPAKGQFLDAVVTEVLGRQIPMAALSGPSLAKEVAAGLPTAVTIASPDDAFLADLLAYYHGDLFRVYQSNDMVGVELFGLCKNIFAIAAGISDGLQLGENARSALITRALTEMGRLAEVLGGSPETLVSLAGVGDLMLTCTADGSRNRRFGLALGEGVTVDLAQARIGQTVEGLHNVKLVHQLAQKNNVEMPITEQIFGVIEHGLSPKKAAAVLLAREPRA